MEHSILFHGSTGYGDSEYLKWLDENSSGFVANIPHPHTDLTSFPIVIHHAKCGMTRYKRKDHTLTGNTQWKACSLSQDLVEQEARRYTQKPLKYCKICFKKHSI